MPNFIKTRQDEVAWNKALDLARTRWKERESNPKLEPIKNIWAYANWLRTNLFSENQNNSLVVETQGLINSENDDQIWKAIRHHTFTTKKELSEEQKYDHIEESYKAYKDKHKDKNCRRTILEFANSYSPMMGGSASTIGGSMLGGSIMGGSMMGGFKDEAPRGPIVYGMDYMGPGTTGQSNPTQKKNALVVVPDKKDQFKPTGELDNQGNLKTDVTSSQNMTIEKANINGPFGDILVAIMDITGLTISEIQELDDEELEDLVKKAIKSDASPQQNPLPITESLQAEADASEIEILVEKDSPIKKARRILALKHKQKKSVEKIDGKKYILNQNDIIKLMSRYGYKYDKKYKKWAKKRSPTYDARRILSDKYQDKTAVQKNEEGEYILDQDEIRKKMHAHSYFYDLNKKRWNQKFETPEQPKPIVVEPTKPYMRPEMSIVQPKKLEPVEEPKDIVKPPEEKEEPKSVKPKEETPVNPIYSLENIEKIKEMEARFILGIISGMTEATKFTKNEETGEYIPEVTKEDIYNKIQLMKYEWDEKKLVWLNENNALPAKLFDIKESPKTLIARAFLATIGKVNKIKVKTDSTPSFPAEELDEVMESQDLYYDVNAERWKVIEEDSKSEIDEDICLTDVNETDHDDEILCESYEIEECVEELDEAAEKVVNPIYDYNISEVGDIQARLLLRALQLQLFSDNYVGTPNEQSAWLKIQTGGDKDPTAFDKDSPKMSQKLVDSNLNKLGFNFNNDKELPLWTKGGDIPQELKKYNMDKKDYIARGIMGIKNKQFIQFDTSDKKDMSPIIPSQKIMNTMESGRNPYTWNDEYGWIRNKKEQLNSIPSKATKADQEQIKPFLNRPFNSLNKKEQEQLKDIKGRRIAEYYSGQSWNDMDDSAKKKAMKKVKLNYDFDKVNKTWKEQKSPKPGFFKRAASTLWNISKKVKDWSGINSSNIGVMLKSWSV